MDNIPLDNPPPPPHNDKVKITPGDSNEVVSQLIQKFDGDDDDFHENNYNYTSNSNEQNNRRQQQQQDDIFQENYDERANDALFLTGGQRDIDDPTASLHSATTSRRHNLSSRVGLSSGAGGDDYIDSHTKLQESLLRLKRNKHFLFAFLVILTITYTSSVISKNQTLRSSANDNFYNDYNEDNKGWDEKETYSNGNYKKEVTEKDLTFDDAIGNGVGFDSFHSHDNTNSEVSGGIDGDELEEGYEEKYEALFGQHDEGDNIYSTSTGGFTYYNNGDKENQDDKTENGNQDYKSKETTVEAVDSPTDIEGEESSSNGMDMELLKSKFGDVDEIYQGNPTEIPFLFFIARTGASLEEKMLLQCHGLVAASGRGDLGENYVKEPSLKVITTLDNEKYINVDLRNPEGVDRAISLDLVGSNLAQFVVAQRIGLVSDIFHTPFKGKCFTFIRHPIERAISVFYALKDSPWEHSFKEQFVDMTIEDYAFSEYLESNWLTRTLTNKMSGRIDINDLDNAKDFLDKKCLIGLTEEFDESHERFMKYFGWDSSNTLICEDEVKLEYELDANQNRHGRNLGRISQKVYDRISDMNELDIKLYEYALELFEAQKSLLVY